MDPPEGKHTRDLEILKSEYRPLVSAEVEKGFIEYRRELFKWHLIFLIGLLGGCSRISLLVSQACTMMLIPLP